MQLRPPNFDIGAHLCLRNSYLACLSRDQEPASFHITTLLINSAIMPPAESLDPLGAFFETRLLDAMALRADGRFEESDNIARELINEPAMSDFHRAGFHLILAHTKDQAYEHAREGVRLYRDMFKGREQPIAPKALETQAAFVEYAHKVLRRTIEKRVAELKKPEVERVGTVAYAMAAIDRESAAEEAALAAGERYPGYEGDMDDDDGEGEEGIFGVVHKPIEADNGDRGAGGAGNGHQGSEGLVTGAEVGIGKLRIFEDASKDDAVMGEASAGDVASDGFSSSNAMDTAAVAADEAEPKDGNLIE